MWIFLGRILLVSTVNTSILWRVDNTTALAFLREEGGLRGRRLLWEAARMLPLLCSVACASCRPFSRGRCASRGMWHRASGRCRSGSWIPTSSVRWCPCGGHPRSTSSLRVSRRSFADLCHGEWRTSRRLSTLSAWSGISVWSSSSHPSPPFEGGEEAGGVEGGFLLVTPHWEAQMWFASLQALPVLEVRCLPFHESLVVDLVTGVPPPSLGRLFLVV